MEQRAGMGLRLRNQRAATVLANTGVFADQFAAVRAVHVGFWRGLISGFIAAQRNKNKVQRNGDK